jgi:cell shape-determining protein MreC
MISVYYHHIIKQKVQLFMGWVLAFLFILIIKISGFDLVIQSSIVGVLSPALSASTWLIQVVEMPVKTMVDRHNLSKRVQMLEAEYAVTLSELVLLEGVAAENQELRQMLENTNREYRETRVSSTILSLARPAISVGSDDGVTVGSEVISQGVLVGTVAEVGKSESIISLLTQVDHPQVLVKTRAGSLGVVSGTGRYLVMDEVSLNSHLEVGDVVVTTGQPGIDNDLIIGQVVRVVKDPASPVKQAHLEQIVDFYQTRIVEIIL